MGLTLFEVVWSSDGVLGDFYGETIMSYTVLLEVETVMILQQHGLRRVRNHKLENIIGILHFIIWMKYFDIR